jgi:hypothetical protein
MAVVALTLSELASRINDTANFIHHGLGGVRLLTHQEHVAFDTLHDFAAVATRSQFHERFGASVRDVVVCMAAVGVASPAVVAAVCHHVVRAPWVFTPQQLCDILAGLVVLGHVSLTTSGAACAGGNSPAATALVECVAPVLSAALSTLAPQSATFVRQRLLPFARQTGAVAAVADA